MSATIINLYGGPGTGKSTTATALFSIMKNDDINCEYVGEFAKELTWQDNISALKCQPYVFGNQYYRLFYLKDKVDYIITDSPILLSAIYDTSGSESFKNVVKECYNQFNNIDIFLSRTKRYNQSGRNQTEYEARTIDTKIYQFLILNDINAHVLSTTKDVQYKIAELLQ